MALLGNPRVEFQYLVDAVADLRQRIDLESQRLYSLEKFPLGMVANALDRARRMAEDVERTRGADFWIKLAQRPGCRIARVRKWRLACRHALVVEPLEGPPRQDHFAPHLEQMRHLAVRRMDQAQWHALDRADVLRHVLAIDAVAAGRTHG